MRFSCFITFLLISLPCNSFFFGLFISFAPKMIDITHKNSINVLNNKQNYKQ